MWHLVFLFLHAMGIDPSADYDTGSLIARFVIVFIVLSGFVLFIAIQVEKINELQSQEISRHEVTAAPKSKWRWRIISLSVFVALLYGSLRIAIILR